MFFRGESVYPLSGFYGFVNCTEIIFGISISDRVFRGIEISLEIRFLICWSISLENKLSRILPKLILRRLILY